MNKTEKVANERWRRATVRRITALETALRDMRAVYMQFEESEFGPCSWTPEEEAEIRRAVSLDVKEVLARVSKLLQ